MENLIREISGLGVLNNEITVFLISLIPTLELRGGLLAASFLHVRFLKALPICIIGNMLPVPFILLFTEKLLLSLEKIPFTRKFSLYLRNKALKNKAEIEKYGHLGLILFVGIPLPGTGAWSGCLASSILHLDRKKAFISIFAGVLLASVIMSFLSYGILGSIIN